MNSLLQKILKIISSLKNVILNGIQLTLSFLYHGGKKSRGKRCKTRQTKKIFENKKLKKKKKKIF